MAADYLTDSKQQLKQHDHIHQKETFRIEAHQAKHFEENDELNQEIQSKDERKVKVKQECFDKEALVSTEIL